MLPDDRRNRSSSGKPELDKTTFVYIYLYTEEGIDKLKEYLNQREQEVFHLQIQEYTTREIGQRLGVSHVRVVRIQQHIRAKGKKIM